MSNVVTPDWPMTWRCNYLVTGCLMWGMCQWPSMVPQHRDELAAMECDPTMLALRDFLLQVSARRGRPTTPSRIERQIRDAGAGAAFDLLGVRMRHFRWLHSSRPRPSVVARLGLLLEAERTGAREAIAATLDAFAEIERGAERDSAA